MDMQCPLLIWCRGRCRKSSIQAALQSSEGAPSLHFTQLSTGKAGTAHSSAAELLFVTARGPVRGARLVQVVPSPPSHLQLTASPKEARISWTGCPERLWLCHPGPGGTGLGEAWGSEWHLCPWQGDGNGVAFKVLPTQTILSFSELHYSLQTPSLG